MESVLKTEKLTKIYGSNKVVNEISMNLRKGDIYGLIGKNGAGKTTFMKMLAGLAAPTGGSIEMFGKHDLEQMRKRIGTLIENPGIYQNMTAEENLEVVRRNFGIAERDAVREMLEFVGLDSAGRKKIKNFSMGMKQRLGLAVALMRNPDFLILDEPINGLDPSGIKEIRDMLLKLNKERQMTILISSHILGELSKVATRYGVIKDGILIKEFSIEELEAKCRKCQKITVSDTGLAASILERQLSICNYDVLDNHVLRIFEKTEESAQINRALILSGVDIVESCLSGTDLESYFMDLMENGGSRDV